MFAILWFVLFLSNASKSLKWNRKSILHRDLELNILLTVTRSVTSGTREFNDISSNLSLRIQGLLSRVCRKIIVLFPSGVSGRFHSKTKRDSWEIAGVSRKTPFSEEPPIDWIKVNTMLTLSVMKICSFIVQNCAENMNIYELII